MKKEIILSFILGAIISSVVGVIAASTISSSSVIYKDDKTVNTVLDELFENVDAIESDDTRLTSLEGKVNTLTSTHSSDITRIDNSIDGLNNDLSNNFGTAETITIGADYTCPSDGIVQVGGYGNSTFQLEVNGVLLFGGYGGNQAYVAVVYSWRVRKGDIIKITTINSDYIGQINYHHFIPYA